MTDLLNYFPFLAIIIPIILFYQQSKNFLLKIFRIFWKERIISCDFVLEFYQELSKKSFVINFDDYGIEYGPYFSKKHNKYLPFLFKLYNFEIFLYKYCIPIFIVGANTNAIKIRYFKFSFPFEQFMKKIINAKYLNCIKEMNQKQRFFISEIHGMGLKKAGFASIPQSIPSSINIASESKNSNYILQINHIINNKYQRVIGVDINDITFGPQNTVKNKYQFTPTGKYVLNQVEKWLLAENWYQERNIIWRRGILLNGKPGNGKSSLILEIAKKISIPLFIFDLSSMDNIEFEEKIGELPNESAILLFEDIDNIFSGRNNITKTTQFGGLTFDCFINKLSGVDTIKNKFIFITTNHLDKVDPAILRPGRIDEIITVQPLNNEEKRKMAEIILDNNADLIDHVIKTGENDTVAEFENRCVKCALKNFWNK